MDDATYKAWWPLHIRKAKGETLNTEEQALYEAGQQQMYAEEKLPGGLEELKQAREEMQQLKAEYNQMRARYEEMEAEIAALEARLDAPAKQLLGVGN